MALVYNIAEYCAPLWGRSTCGKSVNSQLNHTRIINEVIKSTNIQWLPVLANIAPPDVHRYVATAKILKRIKNYLDLPVYHDVFQAPDIGLKSRHPIWTSFDFSESMEEK
jgi:hypothetical protein